MHKPTRVLLADDHPVVCAGIRAELERNPAVVVVGVACGYLLKKAALTELQTALQRVMGGEIYLSRDISMRLLKKFPLQRIAHSKSPLEQLTQRQREILQLIAEGQNTKAIAQILKVSPKTVEYHRAMLMDRLNLHDIPALVRFALRVGLISQET